MMHDAFAYIELDNLSGDNGLSFYDDVLSSLCDQYSARLKLRLSAAYIDGFDSESDLHNRFSKPLPEIPLALEVNWEAQYDPANPKNWSSLAKGMIVAILSFATTTVICYSTSYSSCLISGGRQQGIIEEFHISDTIAALGITMYLLGIAVGSLILAPLSEMYGRKPGYITGMALFTILILPCALADNLAALLVPRFFGAVAGSVMISNSPGTINDIVTEEYRALAFSMWSIGPFLGPVIGSLIGGFVFEVGCHQSTSIEHLG